MAQASARARRFPETWTADTLRQAIHTLQQEVGIDPHDLRSKITREEIVHTAMQPEILHALNGRHDPAEALRDLVSRCALAALMEQGRLWEELDPLYQTMARRARDMLYRRAAQVEAWTGEDPFDANPDLLFTLCEELARYIPTRPMGAHIAWKLRHYEGAVSRFIRQAENLVRHPTVASEFVAFVLTVEIPADILPDDLDGDRFKAHLIQMARGLGRKGIPYEAVVRFFQLPETVAFVKRFAGCVQAARTLYGEDEYADLAWQGARRLPRTRQQGYLDAALATVRRWRDDVSLDRRDRRPDHIGDEDNGRHETLAGAMEPAGDLAALVSLSFAHWATQCALAAHPGDPLWQAAGLLYIEGLTPDEILRRGLAEAATLTAAQARMAALCADPEAQTAWALAHAI